MPIILPAPSCCLPPRRSCAAASGPQGSVSVAHKRSWERSLEQLAAGYGHAIGAPAVGGAAGKPLFVLPVKPPGNQRPRSTMTGSTIQRSTSTASSPGSTSTNGCWNWPGTRGFRSSSGFASARSMRRTWTSSSWSGWPGCSTSSSGHRRPRSRRTRAGGTDRRIQARCRARPAPASLVRRGLRPAMEEQGIRVMSLGTASEEERAEIDTRFHEQVFPALTPLVIGLGRPFPYISNLSLSLGVLLRDPESGTEIIARVKVPKELLGRFLRVGERNGACVPLEEAIAANLDASSPPPRSSTTATSGSPATPTSPSPTRPTTCCRRSRTSSAAAASARSCG